MYGDTFPHYWSALTGNAYRKYAKVMNDPSYNEKAEAALRGVLSMFFQDGSASCAYVYPVTVNGLDADYYDVFANDQDWGLYFMIRDAWKKEEVK